MELVGPSEQDFQQARELLVKPPRFQKKTSLFVLSFVVFAAIAMGSGRSVVELAMLVGVLLAHELGHALAMLLLGYRDVRIFFIPLLGAAAAGRAGGVARWKQAIVLLAGPLPGLVAGYAMCVIGVPAPYDTLALMLIGVNVFNLLPIIPLDGGQLFSVLLFSRHRVLEIVVLWIAAGLTVVAAVYFRWWVMVFVGATTVLGIGHKKRILDAAHELRDLPLPSSPSQLDDAQAKLLHDTAWSTVRPEYRAHWRGKPQQQAEVMQQILDRATLRAPSAGMTVALLAVWLAGWVLAFAGAIAIVPDLQRAAAVRVSAATTPVSADWLPQPIAGITSKTTIAGALAACRANGGVAEEKLRATADGTTNTVLCDGISVTVADGTFSRVEVWYCGALPCVLELVSPLDTDYVTIGRNLEKLGRPRMIPAARSCADHDTSACPRRAPTSQSWIDPSGAVALRLTRTVNDTPGDAPVYLSFASPQGQQIWR